MSGTHVSLVVAVHFPGSARALACWRWRLAIANLLEFWSFVRVVTRRMFRRGHPFGYAQDRLHLHARARALPNPVSSVVVCFLQGSCSFACPT